MPGGDIVHSVIDQFLSKLELEGQLTPRVVEELKRLADQDALCDQDAIEAVLRKELSAHDEAKDS